MKKLWGLPSMALLLPVTVGCDAVSDLLSPSRVTVSLVNNGEFEVQARFFISEDQNTLEALLTELGDELNFTVPAGETTTFTRDCDDLQAIILDDAELRVLGGVGPEADTDVLRDGDDFGCGDTIVFTFDHSDLLLDFDVAVAAH